MNTINLDTLKLPATGDMLLQAGNVYETQKGIGARSLHWKKTGDGPDPIVRGLNVERDAGVFHAGDNETPTFEHIRIEGNPWSFAVTSSGGLTMANVTVAGGAGTFKLSGCAKPVVISDVTQVDPSFNYEAYAGPKITEDASKNIYSERWNSSVTFNNLVTPDGSKYDSGWRLQAINSLTISGGHVSDTAAQSAVDPTTHQPAVTGAALRIHYAGIVRISGLAVDGDVYIGPLDGGDGLPQKLPLGRKRDSVESQSVADIVMVGVTINASQIKVSAGCKALTIQQSTVNVTGQSAVFSIASPYDIVMPNGQKATAKRCAPSINLMAVTTTTKSQPGAAFKGDDSRCSASMGTTVNGAGFTKTAK